jgi:hypothetical protein
MGKIDYNKPYEETASDHNNPHHYALVGDIGGYFMGWMGNRSAARDELSASGR